MKKLVGVSLFVFWAFIAAIFTAGLVFYQDRGDYFFSVQNVSTSSQNKSSDSDAITSANQNSEMDLDSAEIAKHGTTNNCWILVSGKIYDVTNYLAQHPGGATTIIPYCGKDATQAFKTRGGSGNHSGYASKLLAAYYVGDLNQKIVAVNSPAPPASNIPLQNLQQNPPISSPAPIPAPAPVPQTSLGPTEVAKHNSASDCWVIMNGKIYNVTGYLSAHPGGINTILPYCGKDASPAFQAQGHSSRASGLLSSYYIGSLNQTVDTPVIQQNVQNTNNTPPPINRRGDDDDDDDD